MHKYLNPLLTLLLLIGMTPAFSQETSPVTFGQVSPKDFDLPKSNWVDSSTHAVIIADVGNTGFIGNKNSNWISYVFKKNTRIRILNKNAFDLATIRIILRGSSVLLDQLSDLHASTYNLENGKVTETKLNLNDLYRDTVNQSRVEARFTFPGLKEGCIIEYSYTITSFHYWSLPSWSFQHKAYPCLYSKYEVGIPNLFGYLIIHHGQDSFNLNKVDTTKELYSMYSMNVTAVVKKHTWVIKNVPPFQAPTLLEDPYSYMDRIEFDLLQTYNGAEVTGTTNWSTTTNELLQSKEFGMPLTFENASYLSSIVDKLTSGEGTYRGSAKKIYSYVRDNFTCESDDDIYLGNDPYTINRKKKGSVEDLNLLLVAMLRQRRINASPVILSTTEYGFNPAAYPVLDRMNYVVCMIKMGFDTIFLDASNPLNGFGRLPLNCYNGHARIISDHDSGSVFLNKNDIREQKSTTVFVVNDEKGNGQISGRVESAPGYYESNYIRKEIKAHGEKAFFKVIQDSYGPDITMENMEIDSLKFPEAPATFRYDFGFKTDDQDIIYYNPVIRSSFKENPFTAESRKYPIEMPYPLDDIYVLNMEIPQGYTVDELPKSSKVSYNSGEGFFEYGIQQSGTSIQLRTHTKLNKAIFSAEDYNSLRDFFAFIVKKQNEQVVFKKKK
ncbi:MAG TPA: DUF3857 domain-containing protein [Puia sp.]|nr:DUF3857 domain-containing protein [Puia sp.]